MSQYEVVAKSMSEAMTLARERYGNDVCIVDSQVNQFGVQLTVVDQITEAPVPSLRSQDQANLTHTAPDPSVNATDTDVNHAILALQSEIKQLATSVKRSHSVQSPPQRLVGVPERLLNHLGEFTEVRYSEVFRRIDSLLAAKLRFDAPQMHLWFVEGEVQFSVVAKYATMAQRIGVKINLDELEIEPQQQQLLNQILHHGALNQQFTSTLMLSASASSRRDCQQIAVVPATHSERALAWAFEHWRACDLIISPFQNYGGIGELLAVVAEYGQKVVGVSNNQGLSVPILPLQHRHYAAVWLKTFAAEKLAEIS